MYKREYSGVSLQPCPLASVSPTTGNPITCFLCILPEAFYSFIFFRPLFLYYVLTEELLPACFQYKGGGGRINKFFIVNNFLRPKKTQESASISSEPLA